jgi:agmatine deiminase
MIPRFAKKDFILEGGSIHTDGEGTLLTTSCCLLSPGRNPLLSQEQIEKTLKETLNQEKVIFLPKGIVDDETSGHVDNIACFLAPGTVLLATSDDPSDPQYRDSREDAEVLAEETDAKGRKLTVIPLPVPKPLYLTEEESAGIADSGNAIERKAGRRLAASYVNFYLGEKFALVPQFGVPEDEKAVKVLGDFYQGTKKIIPIRSREILLGGGNIHCITKQIPYSEKIAKENEEKEA